MSPVKRRLVALLAGVVLTLGALFAACGTEPATDDGAGTTTTGSEAPLRVPLSDPIGVYTDGDGNLIAVLPSCRNEVDRIALQGPRSTDALWELTAVESAVPVPQFTIGHALDGFEVKVPLTSAIEGSSTLYVGALGPAAAAGTEFDPSALRTDEVYAHGRYIPLSEFTGGCPPDASTETDDPTSTPTTAP